ncbi:MAG: diadenylate cyclase CdaA [Planctomycetota bacterium]|jgi:diadenylate cyclase
MFLKLLQSYTWYEIVIELAVIWICVYLIFRFLRGTRGVNVVKGVAVLLVLVTLLIRMLGQSSEAFGRLNFLYERFLGLLAILLIVVFQPELRQAMIRLGHARFFRGSRSHVDRVVDSVAEAIQFLSKSQFGALVAIERSVKLGGLVEGGQPLDAVVSARLLESIFWPNSPLHDLGVVIRGDRIVAAGVQFPLAEEGMLPAKFGSRHRAALGLALEADCIVVVASEETGKISIVEDGAIDHDVPRDELRDLIAARLRAAPKPPEPVEPEAAESGDEPSAEATDDDVLEDETTTDAKQSPASAAAAPLPLAKEA